MVGNLASECSFPSNEKLAFRRNGEKVFSCLLFVNRKLISNITVEISKAGFLSFVGRLFLGVLSAFNF